MIGVVVVVVIIVLVLVVTIVVVVVVAAFVFLGLFFFGSFLFCFLDIRGEVMQRRLNVCLGKKMTVRNKPNPLHSLCVRRKEICQSRLLEPRTENR